MLRVSHFYSFDQPKIFLELKAMKLLFKHSPPTPVPLRPKYIPQHPVSVTTTLCSSLDVTDQFQFPYTTGDTAYSFMYV
jgi:hypothetical protein